MAEFIRLVLTNVPLICCVLALLFAFRGKGPAAGRYLSWLLLLAVGVDALWAGLFHVFAPGLASQFIGWAPSPFEFEVGIADIALGAIGILSFWRPLPFKEAVVVYAVVFYAGVTIGHVHQMIAADNFAPGNGGLLLVLTVLRAIALPALLLAARRQLAPLPVPA